MGGWLSRLLGREPRAASAAGDERLIEAERQVQEMRLEAQEREGQADSVRAELERAIIDAMYAAFNEHREFATADITHAISRQVPLSVSQRETIGSLRDWLREGRAQSASFEEVVEAEERFVPLQIAPPT